MKKGITLFKKGQKIICYIKHFANKYVVCTGKPSDPTCISWEYEDYEDAAKTAKQYFNNYTKTIFL